MTPLLTLVQTTTYENTPTALRMPRPLWHLFTLINRLHVGWRWYRKVELYKTPGKFFELMAGHALHFMVGDLLIIRIAAQTLLIATRVLECTQQQAAFCREGKKWLSALRATEPIYLRGNWSKKNTPRLLSPSTLYWLEEHAVCLAIKVHKMARLTLKIFKRAFRLSMGIMDVIDAICLNAHSHSEAVNESVVNLVKWIEAIAVNRKALLAGLAQNRGIIERLLDNTPLTYDQFYGALSKAIEGTRAIQKKVKTLSATDEKVIKELGKRIMEGGLTITGLKRAVDKERRNGAY